MNKNNKQTFGGIVYAMRPESKIDILFHPEDFAMYSAQAIEENLTLGLLK